MRLLITGSDGFVGRNLVSHLELENDVVVDTFTRSHSIDSLKDKVQQADMVCHLAGINRSEDVTEFEEVNTGLTELICNFARQCPKKIPVIFSSSIQ
jgi:UDP-2-acetamido-2,6-beta-L-arabino-hexul-4-ose reductase